MRTHSACLLAVLGVAVVPAVASGALLWSDNFDGPSPNLNYTSYTERSGAVVAPNWNHFFAVVTDSTMVLPTLVNPLNPGDYPYNYFGARDIDGTSSTGTSRTFSFNGINIAGNVALALTLQIASTGPYFEDADPDRVIISYSIDGGAPIQLTQFLADRPGDGFLTNGSVTLGPAYQALVLPIGGTGTLLNVIVEVNNTGSTEMVMFDNFELTGVPEPGTSAMFAVGLAALGIGARRKRPPLNSGR